MIHRFVAVAMVAGGLALILLSAKRPVTAQDGGIAQRLRLTDRFGRGVLAAVGAVVVWVAVQLFFD